MDEFVQNKTLVKVDHMLPLFVCERFLARSMNNSVHKPKVFFSQSTGIAQAILSTNSIISAWNPKQPFINGCLVKQPFSI